jgi:hypothetical protein
VSKEEYEKLNEENSQEIPEIKNYDIQQKPESCGEFFAKQKEEWQIQENINKESEELHYTDILFDGKYKMFITMQIYP